MNNTPLFFLNDAPYAKERAYNAMRLAAALAGLAIWTTEAAEVIVF